MLDLYDFYNKMERNKIMLSFKGDVTSELLTSILQIMESKLENLQEEAKVKKKVYNVLVECLQNLYHHMDEMSVNAESTSSTDDEPMVTRSAIFMIGKQGEHYTIITGNYIFNKNVAGFKAKLDKINGMDKEQLKEFYKEVLAEGGFSEKGGGGLGMIDIARKSGHKLDYSFDAIDATYSFFNLTIKINQQ
jgi:hypothetical protein